MEEAWWSDAGTGREEAQALIKPELVSAGLSPEKFLIKPLQLKKNIEI